MHDDYPTGDPNHLTASLLERIAAYNIQYVFGRLNSSTDRMISIFQEFYEKSGNFELIHREITSSPSDFFAFVKESISSTIQSFSTVRARSSLTKASRLEAAARVKPHAPPSDFSSIASIKAVAFTVGEENEKLQQHVEVRVDPIPFAAGAFRFAHYIEMIDHGRKRLMVGKRYIDESHNRDVKRFLLEQSIQMRAAHFAKKFNEALGGSFHVDFLNVVLLSDKKNHWHMTAENFIKDLTHSSAYGKYSNNSGWKGDSKHADAIQAFSHFTFYESGGKEMVVDLQGVNYTLTDPTIHSTSKKFGNTDMGEEGFARFFASHECNWACRKVGLKPIMEGKGYRSETTIMETIYREKLCPYECGNKIPLDKAECAECLSKLQEKEAALCAECSNEFTFSPYYFAQKGMAIPKRCKTCRKKRKIASREHKF